MKRIGRSALLTAAMAALCAYIAAGICSQLFPQPQFTIDMTGCADQNVTVYTYHDEGTPFQAQPAGENGYTCEIPAGYWRNAYHLAFTIDRQNARVLTASINGEEVQAIHFADNAPTRYVPFCLPTAIIRTHEPNARRGLTFGCLFLALMMICQIVRREAAASSFGSVSKALLCGGSAAKAIGKKAFLCALIGVALSFAVAVGNDVESCIGVMNLYRRGVDVFQYQASIDRRNQITLLIWPYNMPLLLFYFIGAFPNILKPPLFDENAYHIGQYLTYKLLNSALLACTIIGVLSYFVMHGNIKREDCRRGFLWSFFNPLVFYVALVFIQLDAFPAYCLAMGCVLFVQKDTPVLAGVLLGLGLSCKMQELLLVPLVGVLFLFFLIKERTAQGWRRIAKTILATAAVMGICLLPNLFNATPLSVAFRFVPQTERVWWTAIPYAPSVLLLLTPGILVFAVVLNLNRFELRQTEEAALTNTLYMFAVVVLLFSFPILSTPSTFIHCLAAFTILNAMTKDRLQRSIVGGLSILVVLEVMTRSDGDVLRLLSYAGVGYTFTALEEKLTNTAAGTRYLSMMFTISHAAMLAFGFFFLKKAAQALEIGKTPDKDDARRRGIRALSGDEEKHGENITEGLRK